jgi:hypothetical protein
VEDLSLRHEKTSSMFSPAVGWFYSPRVSRSVAYGPHPSKFRGTFQNLSQSHEKSRLILFSAVGCLGSSSPARHFARMYPSPQTFPIRRVSFLLRNVKSQVRYRSLQSVGFTADHPGCRGASCMGHTPEIGSTSIFRRTCPSLGQW